MHRKAQKSVFAPRNSSKGSRSTHSYRARFENQENEWNPVDHSVGLMATMGRGPRHHVDVASVDIRNLAISLMSSNGLQRAPLTSLTSNALPQDHPIVPKPHVRSILYDEKRYKTELCRQFCETDSCNFGESCLYAHGHHELRENANKHPRHKTIICNQYHGEAGFCAFGPRCSFVHRHDTVEQILSRMTPLPKKPTSDVPAANLADVFNEREAINVVMNLPMDSIGTVIGKDSASERLPIFTSIAP